MGRLKAASLEPGFEEKVERKRIDAAERAIKILWQEYNALHLQRRKHERSDGQLRIAALPYDLLGHFPSILPSDGRRNPPHGHAIHRNRPRLP